MFYYKYQVLSHLPINLCFIISDEVEKVNDLLIKGECPKKYLFKHENDLFATTLKGSLITEDDLKMMCYYVIVNPYNEYSKLSYGIITHEMIHIRSFIFKRLGMKVALNNDEHEAYLIEVLVNLFMEFYLECKEKVHPESTLALNPFELQVKDYELKIKNHE